MIYLKFCIVASFALIQMVYASEFSDQKLLRAKAASDVRISFDQCTKASKNYVYWAEVIDCYEGKETKEEKYLCIAKERINLLKNEKQLNCKLFKPTLEDFEKRLKELAQ